MPIDTTLIREQVDAVRASEKKRFTGDDGLVDRVVAKYNFWLEQRQKLDGMKKAKNDINKMIGQKKKAKENADAEVLKSKAMSESIKVIENVVSSAEADWKAGLKCIGNIVHESVPVSDNEEADNEVVATFGEFPSGEKYSLHHQLLWRIGGYEPERGSKVAGHRGYFLKGPGVLLNQALINYSLQYLTEKGFTPLQPPYFMNKDAMAGVAQLSDYDDALYHVTGGSGEDKYLIATSEQPICAYHMNETLNPKDLPLRYVGMSTCFRKESGKHGKDTWGIFRVHQFDKIEQFVITKPEDSWEMHEEMRGLSEQFLQTLKIPYRVVNIVSGELNNAAAKKYDIEAWFPGYGEFKELVSCSNCLDYQSRAMGIKYGKGQYVHMLNSTLCALTRMICCILENYQEENGIRVPEVLVPFMGGKDFLPFIQEEKVNVNEMKIKKAAAKKAKGGK